MISARGSPSIGIRSDRAGRVSQEDKSSRFLPSRDRFERSVFFLSFCPSLSLSQRTCVCEDACHDFSRKYLLQLTVIPQWPCDSDRNLRRKTRDTTSRITYAVLVKPVFFCCVLLFILPTEIFESPARSLLNKWKRSVISRRLRNATIDFRHEVRVPTKYPHRHCQIFLLRFPIFYFVSRNF